MMSHSWPIPTMLISDSAKNLTTSRKALSTQLIAGPSRHRAWFVSQTSALMMTQMILSRPSSQLMKGVFISMRTTSIIACLMLSAARCMRS